jgi:hypothetical protein
MEKQEVFDKVCDHLASQKIQSGEYRLSGRDGKTNFNCLYRGPNGTKCAFGIFISGEAYNPKMEGVASTSIIHATVDNSRDYSGNFTVRWMSEKLIEDMKPLRQFDSVLAALQGCHDETAPPNWGSKLERIASEQGLKFDRVAFEAKLGINK